MKAKAIMMPLAIMFTAVTISAGEVVDSIAEVIRPGSVTIISSSNDKKIIVEGREGDPDYRLEYETTIKDGNTTEIEESWFFNPIFSKTKTHKSAKRRNPSTDVGCDIYAGGVIPTDADRGMDRAGWEIGMLNVAKIKWRLSKCGTEFSVGMGWQYRHFTVGDGMMLNRNENQALILNQIPEGYNDVKSSLKSFSLQFPILLRQKIYKKFAIEVGGVAMLNTYTTANCSWKEGEISSKLPLKNLHQRILTLDAIARIGWRDEFAFYVRYSPTQFKPQYGPQYDAIAIGASIGF